MQKRIVAATGKKRGKIKSGPRPKLTCPHCGLIGGNSNMTRWHFDNCRNKAKKFIFYPPVHPPVFDDPFETNLPGPEFKITC